MNFKKLWIALNDEDQSSDHKAIFYFYSALHFPPHAFHRFYLNLKTMQLVKYHSFIVEEIEVQRG